MLPSTSTISVAFIALFGAQYAAGLAIPADAEPFALIARAPPTAGDPGHHWQQSAENHVSNTDGSKGITDAERVANEGLKHDGVHDNDAALRSGVHPTASNPHADNVVTVAEAPKAGGDSVTHHYPATEGADGKAHLDTSKPDAPYTNPNQGGNKVPQPKNRQGDPFKRSIELLD